MTPSSEPTTLAWHDGIAVGFDTETTGVDVATARIVTAAVVARRLGGTSSTQDGIQTWMLDPGIEIPSEATAVHGISTQRAREQGQPAVPGIDAIATSLARHVVAGHPVVAFNAAYDLRLLSAELRRHHLPSVAERAHGATIYVIDPLVLDRALNRYRKGKRTLGALCDLHQVEIAANLHSADADADATLALLEKMLVAHPNLAAMDLPSLNTFQRDAHQQWARHLNEWRASKKFVGEPADESWP